MADTKLTYWENWIIYGPPFRPAPDYEPAVILCDFRKTSTYDYRKLSEIDYLVSVIESHPQPLEDELLRQYVTKWKNFAKKRPDARVNYKEIIGALDIDGRKKQLISDDQLRDLQSDIFFEQDFFKYMVRDRDSEETDDQAILRFIDTTFPRYPEKRRERAFKRYRDCYYSYLRTYRKLTRMLTDIESFDFLEHAAKSIALLNFIRLKAVQRRRRRIKIQKRKKQSAGVMCAWVSPEL